MLIQTMQPFTHLALDPTMSPNYSLAEHGRALSAADNPMDLRAMLNPSVGVPERRNNLKVEQNPTPQVPFAISSTMRDREKKRCYLPPMKVEWSEFAHHETTLAFHLRAGNPSPPQSPCYQQQAFTSRLNHGLPTPPPCSPRNRNYSPTQSQSSHHVQSHITNGPQQNHHSSWSPTIPLSPMKSSDPTTQYQDPYWNVPVEVHHIRISHERSRALPPHRSPHGVSKPSKRKRLGPHSNKAYTLEQVHWMRYFSEDRDLTWPQVHAFFYQRLPGEVRDTVACITSRYYRSNFLCKLDDNGVPVLDENGKFVMVSAKVRERATKEGKNKPYHFVDLHPEWALVYDWVLPEHKERAMRVLQMLDGSIVDNEGKSEGMFLWMTVWDFADFFVEFRNYQRAQRILDGQNKDLVILLAQLNL